MFSPRRKFDPRHPELIDSPGLDPVLLREELATLENFNRRSGGHRLMIELIAPFIESMGQRPVRILDLATGGADIPRALATWFRERGRAIEVVAVDRNPDILRYARERAAGFPEIQFEERDVLNLPYADGSFDLVLCSLALHHFSAENAVSILRQMERVARVGFVANDLRRNWAAIWLTEILARTVIRSSIFRNDAPQSCRAAFTIAELEAMAREAGLNRFRIARHQGVFRMVLTGQK